MVVGSARHAQGCCLLVLCTPAPAQVQPRSCIGAQLCTCNLHVATGAAEIMQDQGIGSNVCTLQFILSCLTLQFRDLARCLDPRGLHIVREPSTEHFAL
jgi:hypothetical protein